MTWEAPAGPSPDPPAGPPSDSQLDRPPVAALEPPPPPTPEPPRPDVPLVPTSRLLAASFELLGRSGADMRRASFYIGLVVLGTTGPLALASFGLLAISEEVPFGAIDPGTEATAGLLLAGLGILAFTGLVVAVVEARTLSMTVLAGRMVDRPVSTRQALARSRGRFWPAIVALVIASVPVLFVQGVVNSALAPTNPEAIDTTSVITSTLITALIAGPFAYVLAGVVLGDVDPFEALRRSFRVFRARKVAASIVVVFDTITGLLVLLGIEGGLDLVLRLFEGLGLGPQAGPIGLAATTVGIVAMTFAFGTLLFTVMAITVAPQVVMFLGLTHATNGLDRVRPGGLDDPDVRLPGRQRFRWVTRLMLLGFALGGLGLALTLATFAG